MTALTDEDRVNIFRVARIELLQHCPQPASLNIRPDMKHGKPRQPDAGQRKLPRGFAVADLNIAVGGYGADAPRFEKRPSLDRAGEIEADEIMRLKVFQCLGRTIPLKIARSRDDGHAARAELARKETRCP